MSNYQITYKHNGKLIEYYHIQINSKLLAVKDYINLLFKAKTDNISELTFWKNNKDYTATINKFLNN